MTQSTTTLQWRAAFAAALLISAGAFLGVCADRLWLVAFAADEEEPQVSVEALATALSLNTRQTANISALMDSIGWAISEAIEQNPESLPIVAREARARLEDAVPFDRREGFRNWMDGRRSNMMDQMRGRGMMRGGAGRGRNMRSDSLPRGPGRGRFRPN
jgi:hypothetical protein